MNNKSLDLTYDKLQKALDGDYGRDLDYIERATTYRDEVENGTQFKISSYGLHLMDEHCPWKSSHLTLNVGHPNVGKSFLDLFLFVMLARKSDINFVVYSAENRIGAMVKQIITMYWGIPYHNQTKQQKDDGFQWADEHFMFIAHTRMYTYKEILGMLRSIAQEGFEYDGALIDPYNSLRLDLKGLQKNDYNIQACEEMRVFCEITGKSILMNCHTTSEAQRARDQYQNVKRPFYADVEGGGPFTAKADDVWVTHRNVRHPDKWMITEFYVEKIRNSEYGGKITAYDDPINFRYKKDRTGYEIEATLADRIEIQKLVASQPKQEHSLDLKFNDGSEDLPFD